LCSACSAVCLHLTVHHNRHVPTAVKELHHLLSFFSDFRPSRLRVRILFESAKFAIFEPEINLLEAALRSHLDRVSFVVDQNVFRAVNEGFFAKR
jgi:hypothetical protein